MKAFAAATAVSVLLLAGCSATGGAEGAPEGVPSAAAPAAEVEGVLAAHGLAGKSTMEIIDQLDRLGLDARPAGLKASVRPHELLLSSGAREYRLAVPPDRFYLSVAPYADRTHDCFHHSLTTCKGELAAVTVQVRVVDETHDRVLLDEARTTFDNGFVGLWLPRDIEGVLRVSYAGKTGETRFATTADAPTCLTTLQVV
ncbi:CueP family metal-binding protein [Actinoplanes missouriensis]|uniref:CueP family metal-binding protein n=1 Tax=Actinoplanes missouriensis TaxID=1866 RepID=UPI0033EDFDE3